MPEIRPRHRSARRHFFALALVLVPGACATGGGAAEPRPLARHADLVGTRWKLPSTEGQLDGRTIEFKRGESSYHGVLVHIGHRLRGKVGAREGLVFMELIPAERPGTFKGFERVPGREELTEVACSVSADGHAMKCDDESTPWMRL